MSTWTPEMVWRETQNAYNELGMFMGDNQLLNDWYVARRAGNQFYSIWRAIHITHIDKHCRNILRTYAANTEHLPWWMR